MPDLLSVDEGNVLMAANITRGHPIHRFGTQIPDLSLDAALKFAGADDTVEPAVLYTRNSDGTYEEVTDWQAVKSDKYGTLGVHSPGFNIKQRREILEMAYEFVGLNPDDSHIDTIGNFGAHGVVENGVRGYGAGSGNSAFFAYVRVPDLVIDERGIADTIERGLLVATSFDGTLPNFISYVGIRVACSNAVKMAMKSATQIIRAKHTRNADERMEQMAVAQGYLGAVEKETVANAERMLAVDGDKALDSLLDHFYPISEQLSDVAKTRRARERGDIRLMYQGQGNTNIDLVGRNGWAAYNAYIEYLDHASGVKVGKNTAKASGQRAQRALLPGKTVDNKITASKIVLELANAA